MKMLECDPEATSYFDMIKPPTEPVPAVNTERTKHSLEAEARRQEIREESVEWKWWIAMKEAMEKEVRTSLGFRV
jgi:hypothetical protein